LKHFRCFLKIIFITIGSFAAVVIILAFTTAPFWIWYDMANKKAGVHRPPDFIVVLGGGGMPSESGLIRCWYGAKIANRFPRAKVIVSLPGDTDDSLSSVNQMKDELILRGISPDRILLEDSGTNTRAEALNTFKIISDIEQQTTNNERIRNSSFVNQYSIFNSVLVVTSPEHMLRAVLTFKKAGFLRVDGLPSFEKPLEGDLSFLGKKLGGRGWMWDVGKNLTIRYQFWIQLNYEFLVMRESCALVYYKLQGWI
jgi:uncharacterized SAM-binding protein YcdF (DUF218 family)